MMFLEGNIAGPPTITVFSWAFTGATTVAVKAKALNATAERRAIRLDMETSPDWVMARGHPQARGSATATKVVGVDRVVVCPSYGRVVQPVSNKNSLCSVKLLAAPNVICRSGPRKGAP